MLQATYACAWFPVQTDLQSCRDALVNAPNLPFDAFARPLPAWPSDDDLLAARGALLSRFLHCTTLLPAEDLLGVAISRRFLVFLTTPHRRILVLDHKGKGERGRSPRTNLLNPSPPRFFFVFQMETVGLSESLASDDFKGRGVTSL